MHMRPPNPVTRDGAQRTLAWNPGQIPNQRSDRAQPTPAWSPDQVPNHGPDGARHEADSHELPPAVMPSTPTVSPASHGSAYTSPDGSRWSWDGNEWQLSLTETVRFRWWRSGVALVGGAVGLAALIGGGILAATQDPNRDLTRGEQMVIRATLQTAGIAQSIHRTETLAYTGSLDDLIGSGFAPVPHVFVTVVSATDGTYCLAAGRVGARPIAWLTQDGESPTACG